MVEPAKKRVEISFDEKLIKRMILPTITISELITQVREWFKLQDKIADLVLELEGSNLEPNKHAADYPNLFTRPCKLRISGKPVLLPIIVSINSSGKKEIQVDRNLSLSEVAKKVLNEVASAYVIQIDGKMIPSTAILKDLPQLNEIIIEFFTENVETISVIIQDDTEGSEEAYSVNKSSTFKDITDYIMRMKNLDPKLYVPSIDGKVIEGCTLLKDIPDISSTVVEFQKPKVSSISGKKELDQKKPDIQKKNQSKEQKKDPELNNQSQKRCLFFSYDSKLMKTDVSENEKLIEVKRKIQRLLKIEKDVLIFKDSSLISEETDLYSLKNIESSVLVVRTEEEQKLYFKRRSDGLKAYIPARLSSRMAALKSDIQRALNINTQSQVWMVNSEIIKNDDNISVAESKIPFPNSEENPIEVIHFNLPMERQFTIVKTVLSKQTVSLMILDSAKKVNALNESALSQWKLSPNFKLIWKTNTNDVLEDEVPLCAQIDPVSAIFVEVKLFKEVSFRTKNNSFKVTLPYDLEVMKLKEMIFPQHTEIQPKYQKWTIDREVEDSQTLSEFGIDQDITILVEENEMLKHQRNITFDLWDTKLQEFHSHQFIVDLKSDKSLKPLKLQFRERLGLNEDEYTIYNEKREIIEHEDISRLLEEKDSSQVFKVYPNVRFSILFRTIKKEIVLSLGLLAKDVIHKIRNEFKLENVDFELFFDKTKLSEDKLLVDHSNSWQERDFCEIVIISTIRLTIIYQKSNYQLLLKSNQNFDELVICFKNLIQERNANFDFYDSDVKLNDATLNQLLSNLNLQELKIHCFRMIEIEVRPEDLATSKLGLKPFKVSLRAQSLVQDLKFKAAETLKLEVFVVKVFWNDHEINDNYSIDEFLEKSQRNEVELKVLNKLKITWDTNQIVKVFHPTLTVKSVVNELKITIPEMDKKKLVYNGKTLPLKSKLLDQGLFGKEYTISVQIKPSIRVEYMKDSFEFTLEENSTYDNLQSAIVDFTGVETFKQLVIIIKDDIYSCILSPNYRRLSDLIDFERCHSYRALVKTKLPVLLLLSGSSKNRQFEIAAEELISQQKKIVELASRIPADKQEWIIDGEEGSKVVLDENKTLESYNITEEKSITVAKKLTLNLGLTADLLELKNILSIDLAKNIKKRIEKMVKISQKEQQWLFQNKEMADNKPFEDYVIEDNYELPISIRYKIDLRFFGFNQASPINPDLFTNLYVESDNGIANVIEQTQFTAEADAIQFRNKILPTLFGIIKKNGHWENQIEAIKQSAYKKKMIKLWNTSHFNKEYLLSYILNSKDPKLNFGVLPLIKQHIPVPLIIRIRELLSDVYWLVQPSYTIASLGIGSKVKGKSTLNNMIFFTSFLEGHQRNPDCEECTEIQFDIYRNEKMLVNFVEIGDETNELVKVNIIKASNLLVVHSNLSDPKKLNELIRSMIKGNNDIPIIIFHRDVDNAFESPKIFTSNLEKAFEEAKQSKVLEIDIENLTDLSNLKSMIETKIISEHVHSNIIMNFKQSSPEDLWKFMNFFDGYNSSVLKKLFTSIEKSSSSLCNAINTFTEYTFVQRNNSKDSGTKENEGYRLIEDLKDKGVSFELLELISFIYSSKFQEESKNIDISSLNLLKLQNFLRNLKIKQTMDFDKLYTFQSDLRAKDLANPEVILEKFSEYWKDLKDNTSCFDRFPLPPVRSGNAFLEFISQCIEVFEQTILPEIFSMELLWREMIYMTTLLPDFQIPIISSRVQKNVNLEQILIDLSKSRIQDGFPVEIIDGNLQHMPKAFLKKVFGGFKENAVVISVLGLQRSENSALLNLLFGSDLSASSGRCTKGIYATFLKLSNFDACGGVLLLDVEGLFGMIKKAESEQRIKFDRKLISFALAISDFVLVNFRNDADKALSSLLMMTLKDSLAKLQQGNATLPEMMLILNQNSQTNKEAHFQGINKMKEFGFSTDNVVVLPHAFDTKEIQLDSLPHPVIKKDPKSDFAEKCRNITNKIFTKIRTEQIRRRSLEEIFNMMERTWETINSYSSRHSNKKDNNAEGEYHIKQAIIEAKNNPNMSKEEKERLFEAAWTKVLSGDHAGNLNMFNREQEAKILFKIICEKYQASLINFIGGFPDKPLSNLDFKATYDQYQQTLMDEIEKMYLKRDLEKSSKTPSRVLDGGIGNVSFKYFDMKKYFVLSEVTEKVVIDRSNLDKIIDFGKIKVAAESLLVGSPETHLNSMVHNINRTFNKFGFALDEQYLKQFIKYQVNRKLFSREPEIVGYYGHPEINDKTNDEPFLVAKDLNTTIYTYKTYHKGNPKKFVQNAVGCLKIDYIKGSLIEAGEISYQNKKIDEMIDAFNGDLGKINCRLTTTDRSKFNDFITSGNSERLLQDFVTVNLNLQLEPQDIIRTDLIYIRSSKLSELLVKINPSDYSKQNYLLFGNSNLINYQVKFEYTDIDWMKYYAANDFSKISSQEKSLREFVSREFNLRKLLKDIFVCCHNHLTRSSQESFKSVLLYRNIANDVNNLIGVANNDLQQACCNLGINISVIIHLSVMHLIWKYFEKRNWDRISQPFMEMEAQKEKQKKFFIAMSSQNKIQNANAEVDYLAEKLISYWKDEFLFQVKESLMQRSAEKFNIDGNRQKVQKELDEKYFDQKTQANPYEQVKLDAEAQAKLDEQAKLNEKAKLDELYRYLCDPYDILESYYRTLVEKYVDEIRTQFSREVQPIKHFMIVLKERFVSVLNSMNKYPACQLKHDQDPQSNEIFYQTYGDELKKGNFAIILDFFKRNPDIFNKEVKLDHNTKGIINPNGTFSKVAEFKEFEFLFKKLLGYLEEILPLISDILNFLSVFVDKIDSITEKLVDVKISDEEIENFKNGTNYHICKQKCPFCGRICGEDDPLHQYHQCKYGHQLRAISGITLSNGSPVLSCCEDTRESDIIQYNGAEKTWRQFKKDLKNHPNNPWIFDDLEKSKDNNMNDRFKHIWALVGQRICKNRYQGNMK